MNLDTYTAADLLPDKQNTLQESLLSGVLKTERRSNEPAVSLPG